MSTSAPAWHSLWRALGAASADDDLRRQLVACWSEPQRHYHTLQHLDECLAQFEGVRTLARHPGEVALALWFHDAFYDPRRDDNEWRSAQWARRSVLAAGLDAAVADRVHQLIMHTRHAAVPDDADARLLVDVDLSILGAPPARYAQFEQQVRAEYAHVPQEQFRQGRSRILRGFLERTPLYHTAPLRLALEGQARDNLRRALAQLQGDGDAGA